MYHYMYHLVLMYHRCIISMRDWYMYHSMYHRTSCWYMCIIYYTCAIGLVRLAGGCALVIMYHWCLERVWECDVLTCICEVMCFVSAAPVFGGDTLMIHVSHMYHHRIPSNNPPCAGWRLRGACFKRWYIYDTLVIHVSHELRKWYIDDTCITTWSTIDTCIPHALGVHHDAGHKSESHTLA